MLAAGALAQSQRKPVPAATPNGQDEPVKVFTEEVRLPVIAVDQFGHYDPTVVPDDVLVLEDGVAQQIEACVAFRPIAPGSGHGGESSGLGGMSKRTSLTREVAIELLNKLQRTRQ